MLPLDGEFEGLKNVDIDKEENIASQEENGPAFEQVNPGDVGDLETTSGVLLPEDMVDIRQQVEEIVLDVVGEEHGKVTEKKGTITLPWPTRGTEPVSEFLTNNFDDLAFPCLFPYGDACFRMNRDITCDSITEWAEHLLWYQDGRFAGISFGSLSLITGSTDSAP